ncbi:MAG: ATP-binding protein [Dehalococcoidales bacterium]|nr:ATP-binding protein [Dehalococcoidales bacterium]
MSLDWENGSQAARRLGIVIAGSLAEGLEVRLDSAASVEDMAVGRYVVIAGQKRKFFGMITDVELAASSAQITVSPPDISDPFIAEVIAGTSTFGVLKIQPMLSVSQDAGEPAIQPVKTVPSHFSPVSEAEEEDVFDVFGREDGMHFYIGKPLDMDTKVCLNLPRLVERSSGVFGKSGTGKTFLTRLLLIGIAQKDAAVNLVFDMHNEYGEAGTWEGGKTVKGLRPLFQSRVSIFTLDPVSSRARGAAADFEVEIGYDQVEPQDIAMLQEALDLSSPQVETVYQLGRVFGDNRWLAEFLSIEQGPDLEDLARRLGLNLGTLQVLRRKIETHLVSLPFLKPQVLDNSVKRILECLDRGIHVVLEFGRHNKLDAYILVANVLTRRIHEQYMIRKEEAMGKQAMEPRPLVITIEEAHKFLNPRVAEFTIFGTIAREMRKYNVTLLVVDQRPSSIADEIMSQIGTRITCLLDDEKDISAVLTGIPGADKLRNVLAKLDSKQQALILGHAVPMPVVIRTREYGTPESYKELLFAEGAKLREKAMRDLEELFEGP